MEYLVEFDVTIPGGTAESEVNDRERAEAVAAARLVEQGHLVRVWKLPVPSGETRILGLYRAETPIQLHGLLAALPLADWMHITVTALAPHPNDPAPEPRGAFPGAGSG